VPGALSADDITFTPPDGWINPDRSINHELVVEAQKKRLSIINERLSLRLALAETPHFLIFSNASAAATNQIVKNCELLYANPCIQFAIDRKEHVWAGKCIILLFQTEAQFADYGRKFEFMMREGSGGYCSIQLSPEIDTRFVKIVIFIGGQSDKRMRQVLVHEGTHAFFGLFRRGPNMPIWVDDGVAYYMEVVNDPAEGPARWQAVKNAIKAGASFAPNLDTRAAPLADATDAVYTMVDFLLKLGAPQFKDFLTLLKSGKDQDTAMKAVYGFDRSQFLLQWQEYVLRHSVSNK
jgi:hypothetical protein